MEQPLITVMKKIAYYVLLLAVPAVMHSCRQAETKPAAAIPDIDVAVAYTDSVVIHKRYPGTLVPIQQVELVARVNGYLMSKNYSGGDFVRQGTVLFTIEDRNYRDKVAQAEAALATAKSTYSYSSSRYEAMKRALEGDAVSKMEVEQAKSTMEEAAASVKNAEAALQSARTQLSYCTVTAPCDGHMGSAAYDVGAYLAGEGSPVALAEIYRDETMLVNFAIEDANALAGIRARVAEYPHLYDSIRVEFSEPLAHNYTGSLNFMSPIIDTATGTMKLQAKIPNTYGELRSGMYATVDLPLGMERDAVLVKDAAISSDQLGSYLYVVNDSNKVVYTPVKTGELVNDSLRIINSGISSGDKYVTKALLKVRDGMTVKPIYN